MDYFKKLKDFNSGPKYEREMTFLKRLMDIQEWESALDYGCGIGTCVKHFNNFTSGKVRGYDIRNFVGEKEWFMKEPSGKFDKIYLMHSIAHMKNSNKELDTIKRILKPYGNVYVITPNKDYCDRKYVKGYKTLKGYVPDTTVVEHFTPGSLEALFRSKGFRILIQGQFGPITEGHQERLFLEAKL